MTLADKLTTIANNIPLVYASGENAKDAEWRNKVYVGYASFEDSNSITIDLPFVPDSLSVSSFDAVVMSTALSYTMISLDRTSFSEKCATMHLIDSTSTARFATIGTATVDTYFKITGTSVIFTPPQSSYWKTSLWRRGAQYRVIATRSDMSKRERLINEVENLGSSGGSVTFSENRVLEVVTSTEWEEIIAPKRAIGWTFVLV